MKVAQRLIMDRFAMGIQHRVAVQLKALPAKGALEYRLTALHSIGHGGELLTGGHTDAVSLTRLCRRQGIVEPTQQTLDALMKLDLSAGVDVEIRTN